MDVGALVWPAILIILYVVGRVGSGSSGKRGKDRVSPCPGSPTRVDSNNGTRGDFRRIGTSSKEAVSLRPFREAIR